VAWIGRDDNGVTALTGATGALRVWSRLMAEVSHEPRRVQAPEGVVELWIDEAGGGVSAEGCPNAKLMPFLAGTEPRYEAPCSGGLLDAWQRRAPAASPPAGPGTPPPAAAPPPAQKQKDAPWWERWFRR
jgi:penicillin-binding protein 1B